MANRNDDRGRMFERDEERWDRESRWDREGRWSRGRDEGDDSPEWRGNDWDRGAVDRGDDRWESGGWDRGNERWDRDEPYERPRRRRFGHAYGRFGSPEGVGAAAGYAGFGGPGWTAGGFGDPGYNTSGFGSPHYGTSRTGASYNDATHRPFRFSRDVYSADDRPRWDRGGDDRMHHERTWDESRWEGPHTGRGPRGYQRGDERIREDVSERLMDDGRVDAVDVEVSVTNGEVTLTGTVPHRRMKRLAEDVAESVRGVRDVHNQLRIGEPAKADQELSLTPEAEKLNRERSAKGKR